jgi:hypothetical protein
VANVEGSLLVGVVWLEETFTEVALEVPSSDEGWDGSVFSDILDNEAISIN